VTDHYFSARPDAPHRPGLVRVVLPDVYLELATDSGVFSPGRLDPGTRVLLDEAPAPPPAGPGARPGRPGGGAGGAPGRTAGLLRRAAAVPGVRAGRGHHPAAHRVRLHPAVRHGRRVRRRGPAPRADHADPARGRTAGRSTAGSTSRDDRNSPHDSRNRREARKHDPVRARPPASNAIEQRTRVGPAGPAHSPDIVQLSPVSRRIQSFWRPSL